MGEKMTDHIFLYRPAHIDMLSYTVFLTLRYLQNELM